MNVHYITKYINPTGRNTNTLFKQNIFFVFCKQVFVSYEIVKLSVSL